MLMVFVARRRRSRSRDRRRRSRSRDRRRRGSRSPRRDKVERKFPLVKHETPDTYQYSNVAVPDEQEFDYDPNMPLKIKDIKKEDSKGWQSEIGPEGPLPPPPQQEAGGDEYGAYNNQHYQLKPPSEVKEEPQ